jgi:hypothetical protein
MPKYSIDVKSLTVHLYYIGVASNRKSNYTEELLHPLIYLVRIRSGLTIGTKLKIQFSRQNKRFGFYKAS